MRHGACGALRNSRDTLVVQEAYALYNGIARVADIDFVARSQFVVAEVDAHTLSSNTSTGGNTTLSDLAVGARACSCTRSASSSVDNFDLSSRAVDSTCRLR